MFAGDFQTTEYAADGIIVPKLFYKSFEPKKDQHEEVKYLAKPDVVLNVEDLTLDMEILKETSKKKILTEGSFKFPLRPKQRFNQIVQFKSPIRKFKHPVAEMPLKSPLKARYQPSVPVVQVNIFFRGQGDTPQPQ